MPCLRFSRTLRAGLLVALLATGGAVIAQIEDSGRGVAPIASSGSFEVSGVSVDVAGANAEAARTAGWRLAQRKGWDMLSRRLTGRPGSLPDSALDSLVSGIVIENEQIGPNRYIAKLGVLFNRGRAGSILGVAGETLRSPALLVVPLQESGGAATVFERATPWQEAWARFRTGNSVIDYVRLTGTGPDALLVNGGQVSRRGRGWWRTILDQYGAADVLIPQVKLRRQWPGGPVIADFSAGYGPDHHVLTRFTLRVERSDALPALLDEGVRRIDAAYQQALRQGALRIDPALSAPPPGQPLPTVNVPAPGSADTGSEVVTGTPEGRTTLSIQFDTPGVAAVASSEASVRAVAGVRSAVTTSLALGGVSVMRVVFDGDPAVLSAALQARGWQVTQGGGVLRIRRAVGTPSPTPSAAPAAPTGG
ncbi:heavy-metal-associated domain-containing protein [Sphingomonas desiccabilis]|uniref:Heavy-metal-associated domain-containing protein n=1 Tax=Sphingomonas desiccabilis TaxID=429134 RepID=A0A4Q2J0G4_9SPHN|nr:heavy-metal-associated domain-containing protein [Sphingomonas desiccabilis]RXZ35278.1 heavy-metal-associated domain-containing protein [Sphingomonas desiccabilis]